jgi:hypothetical protein
MYEPAAVIRKLMMNGDLALPKVSDVTRPDVIECLVSRCSPGERSMAIDRLICRRR